MTEDHTLLAIKELAKSLRSVDGKLDTQSEDIHDVKRHLVKLNGTVARACKDIVRIDQGLDVISTRIINHGERLAVVELRAHGADTTAENARTRSWENYAKIGQNVVRIANIVLMVGLLAKLAGVW